MQVSQWLGHSTNTLTLDIYGDWIPEQDGGASNNLPEPTAPATPAEVADLRLVTAESVGALRERSFCPSPSG